MRALAVGAAVTGRREHVRHAAPLDPHATDGLDPERIAAPVDEPHDPRAARLSESLFSWRACLS